MSEFEKCRNEQFAKKSKDTIDLHLQECIYMETKTNLLEEKKKSQLKPAEQRFFGNTASEISPERIASLLPKSIRYESEEFQLAKSVIDEITHNKIRAFVVLPHSTPINSIILRIFASFVGDRRIVAEKGHIETSFETLAGMNAEIGDIVRFLNAIKTGTFEMEVEENGKMVKKVFLIKRDGHIETKDGLFFDGQPMYPEALRPLIGYLEEKSLITNESGRYIPAKGVNTKNMVVFINAAKDDGIIRHEAFHVIWDNYEPYRKFIVEKIINKLTESQKERIIVNALLSKKDYGWLRSEAGTTFLVDEMVNAYRITSPDKNSISEIRHFDGKLISKDEHLSISGIYNIPESAVNGLLKKLSMRFFDSDALIRN